MPWMTPAVPTALIFLGEADGSRVTSHSESTGNTMRPPRTSTVAPPLYSETLMRRLTRDQTPAIASRSLPFGPGLSRLGRGAGAKARQRAASVSTQRNMAVLPDGGHPVIVTRPGAASKAA